MFCSVQVPDFSKKIVNLFFLILCLLLLYGDYIYSLDSCADVVASVSNVGNCVGSSCEVDVRFSFGLNLENPHKICLKAKTNDVIHDLDLNITLAEHHVVNNLINCYHSDEFKVITQSKCSCDSSACPNSNCPIGQSNMENNFVVTYNQHFSRECVPPIINWFVDHYTAVLRTQAKMTGSYRYLICEIGKKVSMRNSVKFETRNRTELVNYLEDENKFVSLGNKIKVLDFRVDEEYNEYEGKVFIHDRADKGNFYIIDKKYVNTKGEFDPKKIGFFKSENMDQSTKELNHYLTETVIDCPKQKINFKYDIVQNSELLEKFEKYHVNDLNDKVIFSLNPEENLIYPKAIDTPVNKYIYDLGFYYYDSALNDYVLFGFDRNHQFIFSRSTWYRVAESTISKYEISDSGYFFRTNLETTVHNDQWKCQTIQYGDSPSKSFSICEDSLEGNEAFAIVSLESAGDGMVRFKDVFPNGYSDSPIPFYVWPDHKCKSVPFTSDLLLRIDKLDDSDKCSLSNIEMPQEVRARIDKGNFELVVSMAKMELQFYEDNVVPAIEKCSFEGNNLIINARSTATSGDVVLTTSPDSVFQDRISLTNILTDYKIPPTQNFKGELTVTIQNRDKKATCKVTVDTKFDPSDFGIKTKPSLNEELLDVAKGQKEWYYTLLFYVGIVFLGLFCLVGLPIIVGIIYYYGASFSWIFDKILWVLGAPIRIMKYFHRKVIKTLEKREKAKKSNTAKIL